MNRIPCRTGDEHDALSRRWRHYLHWYPGERKRVKRQYNRRWRRLAKRELCQAATADLPLFAG